MMQRVGMQEDISQTNGKHPKSRYEEVQVKSLRDQKEEYYSKKMDWDDQPSVFIVNMDCKRKDLQKLGYGISCLSSSS